MESIFAQGKYLNRLTCLTQTYKSLTLSTHEIWHYCYELSRNIYIQYQVEAHSMPLLNGGTEWVLKNSQKRGWKLQ